LRVRSALPLPELADARADEGPIDVRIDAGAVPERLDGAIDADPWMQVSPEAFQLNAPPARYRVTGGRRIVVQAEPGASERDVRLYLLGTVLGALCHQRGLAPFHAAALEVDGEALAIAGPSGAGKSTLAAQFQARGGKVLADDLCAVEIAAQGRPTVRPGLARVKLWGDSLALAGLAGSGWPRIGDDIDKFSVPVDTTASSRARLLRRLYILRVGAGQTPVFHRLAGPEAVHAAVGAVYRWPVAVAMGRSAALFAELVTLAASVEIFELAFTHDASAPFGVLSLLERHWGR
jgi:hypothetical protein